MLFFDIGANVGKWTISNINLDIRIIAVEPSVKVFTILKDNVERLPDSLSKNIELVNAVITNEQKPFIDFYECKKHRYSTTNKDWVLDPKSRFYGKEFEHIQYNTSSIDNLILTYGVPNLIKIDVEGGEYECIRSLSRKVPLLCFEWALEFADLANKCLQYLYILGFKYVYLQYEDVYTFRPFDDEYVPLTSLENMLKTFPNIEKKYRDDWGMIWCK